MQLSTERLTLREFAIADTATLHAWQNDPRYLEHYPWDATALEDTEDLVGRFLDWQNERPRRRWQFAVELAASGKLIGTTGLRQSGDDPSTADIGYALDPEHWGRGYATEATGRIVEFGFEAAGLRELTARIVRGNGRSVRVLERLGFAHSFDLPPGPGRDGREWPPRSEYRLLREDWKGHG